VKRWLCIFFAMAVVPIVPQAAAQTRRVNAPYFAEAVRYRETAIFWFGRVDPYQNYTDVRVGYTSQELWVHLSVFDQWLWQDDAPSRTPASLVEWDAATLVLDRSGDAPASPSAGSYRFVGELSGWRPRTDYQAAYVGTGSAWSYAPDVPFTTETGWRGDALNTSGADRGWTITFHIPFASLGLSGPPTAGTVWRLGVLVHDRDAAALPAVSDKFWPETFLTDQPATWGELAFGLRQFQTVPAPPSAQTYTIRQGLEGATVVDAMVGGGSTCGEGSDFFGQWGSLNYAGSTTLVVQNQGDVADWPCFSKTYIDFPLGGLPAGQQVISATLTVYQFGGSDPSQAQSSLVQVLTVADPWAEDSIAWNNAPLATENVAGSWVDPLPSTLPWPGAARTWDLSWAVAHAVAAGQPVLRLVLYEADGAYHSGKYFTSSDAGDWNATGRPTLQVVLSALQAPSNLRIIRRDP